MNMKKIAIYTPIENCGSKFGNIMISSVLDARLLSIK